MSPHVFEEKSYDKTSHKFYQRRKVGDLFASCESLLTVNCPTKEGANWLYSLRDLYPHKTITVADKLAFKKGWLEEFTRLKSTDIFSAVFTNPSELIWADLFGGLAQYAKLAVERSEKWRHFVLTFSNVCRGKTAVAAVPKGQPVLAFMNEWCELQGWQLEMIDTPYQHENKITKLKQVVDRRSPWYYTFHIAR